MHADFNFTDDEWFWKAWSETISKRTAKTVHSHYSRHASATIVNEQSLLSSEFLEQYAALAMLLERFPSAPATLGRDLASWRPRDYEAYFRTSGLQDGQFAIAAFANAPAPAHRAFIDAVSRLNDEALSAVEAVGDAARRGRADLLPGVCAERAARMGARIAETAKLIAGGAPGQSPPKKSTGAALTVTAKPV